MNAPLTTALEAHALDDADDGDGGDSGRQRRGMAIAAMVPIRKHKSGYRVPAQSADRGHYTVKLDGDRPTCTCPDYELRQRDCKHIVAARLVAIREAGSEAVASLADEVDETVVENTRVRPTYGQDWKSYDAAQEHEGQYFPALLQDLCNSVIQPEYGYGRPKLPISDMLFCIARKEYSGLSRRRVMSIIRDDYEKGLISHKPSSGSLTKYIDDPDLTPILKQLVQESARPLAAVETKLAVDATGFSTRVYDRWFEHKWGKSIRQAKWIKAHIMCGTLTNIITAVEVTSGNRNDTKFLPRLLRASTENFDVKELSADKGYLSKKNFNTAAALGVDLYMPFKVDSRERNPKRRRSIAWEKAFRYYHDHREEFLQHYHLRSNAESTMQMLKSKFGTSVRSRTQAGQFNELLARCLCHNICVLIRSMYEFGIEVDFHSQVPEPGPWLPDKHQGLERLLALA